MKENIRNVVIAFLVAILFYVLLQFASLKNEALVVCTIVFFGITLLQFALQIKRLLEKR